MGRTSGFHLLSASGGPLDVDLEATVFGFGRCLGGKLLSH
jgi:hypothetical protein